MQGKLGPNEIIEIELNFFRALVARSCRLFLLAMRARGFHYCFTTACVNKKLLAVRTIGKNRLLKNDKDSHPKEEKRG